MNRKVNRGKLRLLTGGASKPPILKGFGIRESLDAVTDLRRRIREADESVSDWELRDLWDEVQVELGKVRLFGDLVLAAFFEGDKPKERESKRSEGRSWSRPAASSATRWSRHGPAAAPPSSARRSAGTARARCPGRCLALSDRPLF